MSSSFPEESDYEILKSPTDLRKKVRKLSAREAAKFDPVKAAEAALKNLSHNFGPWMDNETRRLLECWVAIQKGGVDQERLDTLFQSAHNIKGQALTLGFPLVGQVAAGFCHLIENVKTPDRLPLDLSGRYVEAIRAMVMEGARDTDNSTGVALLQTLEQVTDEYIAGLPDASPS